VSCRVERLPIHHTRRDETTPTSIDSVFRRTHQVALWPKVMGLLTLMVSANDANSRSSASPSIAALCRREQVELGHKAQAGAKTILMAQSLSMSARHQRIFSGLLAA
jgi:hypothetical protein